VQPTDNTPATRLKKTFGNIASEKITRTRFVPADAWGDAASAHGCFQTQLSSDQSAGEEISPNSLMEFPQRPEISIRNLYYYYYLYFIDFIRALPASFPNRHLPLVRAQAKQSRMMRVLPDPMQGLRKNSRRASSRPMPRRTRCDRGNAVFAIIAPFPAAFSCGTRASSLA